MNEDKNNDSKTFGYRLAQVFMIIVLACVTAILIGGTIALLRWIF